VEIFASKHEENEMKSNTMTAWHAVLFNTLVISTCLMLVPLSGMARSVEKSGFDEVSRFTPVTPIGLSVTGDSSVDKLSQMTPQEFIEQAAVTKVDIHDLYFELRPYEGTQTCLMCHAGEGQEMLNTGHFKWAGKTENIDGLEDQEHGKNDLINNFCVAVPTNEPRCTQCHAGFGYKDSSYDFSNPENVDCLVCHDQSGTYKKGIKSAGLPDPSVDLQVVAGSIEMGVEPTRKACISCHSHAGGGDNVKHGDLSSDIVATTREFDVHMGTDGGDLSCVACHAANHDPVTGEVNHGIAGMSLHSVNEGEMRQCNDCHGGRESIHS
jgi:hypothetical protein